MAHIKFVSPSSWDFGEPSAAMVKWSTRGLIGNDRRDFIKRAGDASHVFLPYLESIKVAADEVPMHVISHGAYEKWGWNRNGDGFLERVCREFHPTFEKFARSYRNHANKDPAKSYGYIKKAAYNNVMHRVELLTFLNATKEAAERNGGLVADQEIEKLSRDGDLATSMACITNPDTPVLTGTGYKRIEDVVAGDLVHTHRGRWKPVTGVNRRTYTGEVLTLHFEGLAYPLELTADHPMYAKMLQSYPAMKVGQRPVGQWKREVEQDGDEPFSWIHAEHLDRDDRIECRPVLTGPSSVHLDDPTLCGLLGSYAAEWSIGHSEGNPTTVVYTVNARDWAVDGVPALVGQLWPEVTCTLRPRSSSKVAFSLEVHSAALAQFMARYVGTGFASKRIPMELFGASDECKLSFLGRWLDGDGWADKKGVHWSSGNLGLILQGRDLLLSLGLPTSIYRIDHAECETSGYAGSGVEYTLNLAYFDAPRLVPWSDKLQRAEIVPPPERARPPSLYPVGDVFAYRIKKIERRRVANCPTWNIEVADDESYGLLGMTSHNCRVPYDECSCCKNHAKTRDEYCTADMCKAGGCKDNLTRLVKIAGDVHHLGVFNPSPCWFDSSVVFRPADPTAYGHRADWLTKAAADGGFFGTDGAKLAAADDFRVPLGVILYQEDADALGDPRVGNQVKLAYGLHALERHAQRASPETRRAFTPSLQPAIELPDMAKLAEALGALADRKIVVPLRDFARLTKRAELLDGAAGRLPGVLGRMLADGSLRGRLARNPYPGEKLASLKCRELAAALVPTHSLEKAAVDRRAMLASIRGLPVPATIPGNVKCASADPRAEELARDYSCYQVAALERIARFDDDFPLTARYVASQNQAI